MKSRLLREHADLHQALIILGWTSREGQRGRPSTRGGVSPPGGGGLWGAERTWLSALIPLFVCLAVALLSGSGTLPVLGFRSTVLLNTEAKCEQQRAGGADAHTRRPAGMLLEELQGLSGVNTLHRSRFTAVYLSVCLFDSWQNNSKSCQQIFMKFPGNVDDGQRDSWLSSGDVPL